MRLLIIGDPRGRDDEGMKRVNRHLSKQLIAMGHDVLTDQGFSRAALLSRWGTIVLTGGPSRATLLKILLLRIFHPRSEIVLCGLMPSIPAEKNIIISHCVDRIVSGSKFMSALGTLNDVTVESHPASTFSFEHFLRGRDRRRESRRLSDFKLLHVGHLNQKRNVSELAAVCKRLGLKLTFLVSKTEQQDLFERDRLERLGVTIVDEYQHDLFMFYRQFDLYVFPVERSDAAIAMPLSIVEALLSGLPVLTTDFGDVKSSLSRCAAVKIVNDLKRLSAEDIEEAAGAPMADIDALKMFDTASFANCILKTK